MAGPGGKREGAGRKPLAIELNTAQLARETLITKFGTLNDALIALWDSGEPSLMKFVAEHAFGKPLEKQEIKHEGAIPASIEL